MTTLSASRRRRILSITPNPALDLTYVLDRINVGESHRVRTPMQRAGGKGLNVARVAHQLGHPVLAVAPVGGTTGSLFRSDLETSGVPHLLVSVTGETRKSIAIVETAEDRTSIFNELGSALQPTEWRELGAAIAAAMGSATGTAAVDPAVLVGSGSLPESSPAQFYPDLVRLAHSRGIPAIIDTSGAGIIACARAGADLLKPNHHELMDATGESDLFSAARGLLDLGARRVLVSLGAEGMLAFSADLRGSCLKARLPQPLSGNPTGAGDAAVAAAAAQMASGTPSLEQILRSAAAWSAAAVLMPGAGEISPRYKELEEQLIITKEELT